MKVIKEKLQTYTAVYKKTKDGWYVVSVEEIPGALTQGKTLKEARENIRDAAEMMLAYRHKKQRSSVLTESLCLPAFA